MRKIYMVMLVVFLMFGVFTNSLYSWVESQIEGVIVDENTGVPLSNAKVTLYEMLMTGRFSKGNCNKIFELSSDNKGYFKFKNLGKGYFFITIVRDGYALYGTTYSFSKIRADGERKFDGWEPPPFTPIGIIPPKNADKFFLKEGRIKHLKIKLMKEAKIDISIEKIGSSGFIGYSDLVLVDWGIDGTTVMFHRNCLVKHLAPGEYKVHVLTDNYETREVKFELKKGETYKINQKFDFTKGTVLYGVVKNKKLDKLLSSRQVRLFGIDNNGINLRTSTDKNDMYWFGGLKAGKYIIKIRIGLKYIKKIVTISNNEIKKFDFIYEK